MLQSHRTWVTLDAAAFSHNIACFKRLVGHEKHLAVVVKSDAYGHGLAHIAKLASAEQAVHMVCTASLSEALALRTYGFKKSILVLGILDMPYEQAILHDIDLMVDSRETIKDLNNIAQSLGASCSIHLKVDTGLARLGVPFSDAVACVQYAQSLPAISLKGLCSHFAEASNTDHSFTEYQYQQFMSLIEQLKALSIHIPYCHIANTAGSILYAHAQHLTMVRIGAGAYGMVSDAAMPTGYALQQILTWHARICQLHTLPAGTPIGYERTFVAKRETRVALLPIGYYDGYDKRLSNKAVVFVPGTGKYAPIIGRISMNMAAIDVTDMDPVSLGDEVILTGNRPEIHACTLAALTGCNNPREITLHIHHAIPRIVTIQPTDIYKNAGQYCRYAQEYELTTKWMQ